MSYFVVLLSSGLFCGLFRRSSFVRVILLVISSFLFRRGCFVGYFVVLLSWWLFCGLFRRSSFVGAILWAISSSYFDWAIFALGHSFRTILTDLFCLGLFWGCTLLICLGLVACKLLFSRSSPELQKLRLGLHHR